MDFTSVPDNFLRLAARPRLEYSWPIADDDLMKQPSEYAGVFQGEAIHDRWESVYRNNRWQDRLNDKLMDRLVTALKLPPGARVLDAGCGTGDHTLRLARRGFHCVGLDISQHVLRQGRQRAADLGLAGRATFVCTGLEDIPAAQASFDAVHCRGVLMHIPRFGDALAELCRLLKPGGRMVILENNHKSLETLIVRSVRKLRGGRSKMVRTEHGLEFHNPNPGEVPLWRVADVKALMRQMHQHHVRPVAKFASEFWDINRFRRGWMRNGAVAFNLTWFTLHLPARWSLGNVIVGEKNA
jgi:ubiquinone/menaquinone biosynthesis C-methylase UbiE